MIGVHKLMIKCEEIDEKSKPHPHCPHGPTLFFYYQDEGPERGYYACAAHRGRKTCSFHLPVTKLTPKTLSRRYDTPTLEYRALRKRFLHSPVGSEKQRHYCHTCQLPVLSNEELVQHIGHELAQNLSTALLRDPTQFLRPLDNDKVEAQYFFDKKALKFFEKCMRDLQISKVLCIGAPRLHAHLRTQCSEIKSFLLDFDHRFYNFFKDKHYAWYNMCNNHFFDIKQETKYKQFLKCQNNERLLIFTDPPFGCRTEPIAHTLHQIRHLYNTINQLPLHAPLPIFWIFPYFSATYIQQQLPELQMCDYKVNYTNHAAYTDSGGVAARKLGSPVRMFTNVPLQLLLLPVAEEYKYCANCQKYTALENRHCAKCNECPARNGSTYRHCELCGVCVKPSYVHCGNCRRCTQAELHNCKEYQARQHCWICLQPGHTEHNCLAWQQYCKKLSLEVAQRKSKKMQPTPVICCLLCGTLGHNERRCKQREKYIDTITFLGETQLNFKC